MRVNRVKPASLASSKEAWGDLYSKLNTPIESHLVDRTFYQNDSFKMLDRRISQSFKTSVGPSRFLFARQTFLQFP